MRPWHFALLLSCALTPQTVFAGIVYQESNILYGDLSGDRLAPSAVSLAVGDNQIIGTTFGNTTDLDYFTISIGTGFELTGIVVDNYVSADDTAMIAVTSGTTFSQPATGLQLSGLLGWSLFGLDSVGDNIMPSIGQGIGSIKFSGALGAGDYSIWVRQSSLFQTDYTLNFQLAVAPGGSGEVTVPEASSLAMLGMVGVAGIAFRSVRKRSKCAA